MAIRFELKTQFDFGSADYHALYGHSRATAFQHPVWLKHLYGSLLGDAKPLVVCGHDESGALCVVLPLMLTRMKGLRIIEAPNLGVTDYVAPIVRDDMVVRLGEEAGLRKSIGGLLPAHDILRIRHVRADQRNEWDLFFQNSWQTHAFSAHATELGRDFATWRAGALSGSFRRYLDRKGRRLSRDGNVELIELTDTATVRETFDYMAEVRKGRFENDGLQQERYRAFYTALSAEGIPAGLVKTYALRLDGADMGRVFGLTHGARFHFVMVACNYDLYGKHSPGLVVVDMLIRQQIDAGDAFFDFTIGDEAYKKEFGTAEMAMFQSERAASLAGLGVVAVRRLGKHLKTMLKSKKDCAKRFGESETKTENSDM